MKISKQARREGKALFRSCLTGNVLDEARVRSTVENLISVKPRGYLGILSHFHRLLKLHLESRHARVENAVESTPELMEGIKAALERRYGPGLNVTFNVNPDLIAGLRVRVGSDVYDGSIRSRLEELKAGF